ncbi:hypothetical protein ISS96_01545 [Candidatus Bathyarchaeota archaeon]|nr:hypothetical protein [Candidatus Bathyarchaeota archaeon]
MPSSELEEVVKEIRALREKVERVEEIVEERLIGLEEPMEDEVKAIESYLEAKKRGDLQLIPLEDVSEKA